MNAREQAAFDIMRASVNDLAHSLGEACEMLAKDDPASDVTIVDPTRWPKIGEPAIGMDFEMSLSPTLEVRRIINEETSPGLEQQAPLPLVPGVESYAVPMSEFYAVFHRALNTWEPHLAPKWAPMLADKFWQREGLVTIAFEQPKP